MSCADVMYQPYTPYFPYQRPPPHMTPSATTASATVTTSAAELIPIAPYDVKAYTSGFQNWRGLSHMNTSHLPEGLFPLENLKHKFGVPKLPEPMEQGSPDFVLGNTMLNSPMNLASSTGTTNTNNNRSTSSVSSSSRAANSSTASAASSSNELSTDVRLSASSASDLPNSRVSSSSASSSTAAAAVAPPRVKCVPPSTDAVKSELMHATDAQYISANCVLFTYYSGDISTVVDEHFSRALSCGAQHSKGFVSKDTTSPMSQRNFPPSFWNSHYVYQGGASMSLASLGATHIHSHGHAHPHGHPELSYGGAGDPYHHAPSGLHGMHQTDPWHYPLTSQSPYAAHRPMHHELAAYNGQSGFSPQYGSLLLQPPSVRSSRLGAAQCSSLAKPSDAHWSAAQRYHEHLTGSDISSHLDNYGGGHGYTSMCSMPEVEARGFFQTHESYN